MKRTSTTGVIPKVTLPQCTLVSSEISRIERTLRKFLNGDKEIRSFNRTDLANLHSPVNSESLNVEEGLHSNLQLLVDENQLLKGALHLNNIALKKQFDSFTHWNDEVIQVHRQNLQHFEETKAKSLALMEETHTLRNELLTTKNRNRELQKTIEQLKSALVTSRAVPPSASSSSGLSPLPGPSTLPAVLPSSTPVITVPPTSVFVPNQRNQAVQSEVDQERAKARALEQRLVDVEAKSATKQDELIQIIGVLNKKLESSERSRVTIEKELSKAAHQKRELEKKLLSMQGSEKPLICQNADLMMDSNLWSATNEFLELAVPTLSLCAGETVESLACQLRMDRKHLARAKDLLNQHQDQLTNLMAAIAKPCACRASMDAAEASEVGETIDTLFRKIQTQQEIIAAKDDELHQLKNRKAAMEVENDKVAILKSQILVYRTDFLAEKKAREDAIAERDRVLAELKLLRDENKQLVAQVNSQGTSTSSVSRLNISDRELHTPPPHLSISSAAPSGSGSPEIINEPVYVCPNPECKRKFDTLEPLQNHVYSCLQLSD